MSETHVLIVGAGPTGLVLALELARRGVDFRLVDRAPERSRASRAIAVQARTLEMLDLMGLGGDTLQAKGHPVSGGSIFERSGTRRIVHIDFSDLPSRYPMMLLLPQWETEEVLQTALAARGGRIERGLELSAYSTSDRGLIARLSGPAGEARAIAAKWIVGCDGGHSRVREIAGISFAGSTYENVFALADLRIDGEIVEDEFQVFTHEDGPLAIFPLGGGLYRIVADNPPASFGDDPSLADCQALVDARGPAGLRLRDPVWMSRARIHRRSAGQLRRGRVFLAGDAGNLHSPAGGQGMNTGMQDAFNLGWKLALATGGVASEDLLDSYEAERQPVEDAVVRASDFITRAVTLGPGAARFLRDHLAPLLTGLPAVERRIGENLAELTVRYRDSRMVIDRGVRGATLQAGDRAGDFELAGRVGGRLFEQFTDGRHVALIFGGGHTERLGQALQARFGAWLRVLPAQSLTAGYGTEAALYLLRPDGIIGLRCAAGAEPLDFVEAYWARLSGQTPAREIAVA
jgi:2-polyprenyl-6-methoxyphenol hydroxylase-like FAD-dependent oxidoreductase